MAYNPNELAKVKHIIALAKAISGNLDGDLTDTKTTPTFSATKTTFSKAAAGPSTSQRTDDGWIHDYNLWRSVVTITYNGDGNLAVSPVSGVSAMIDIETAGSAYSIAFDVDTSESLPKTITISATETDTYKAATPITITLTA